MVIRCFLNSGFSSPSGSVSASVSKSPNKEKEVSRKDAKARRGGLSVNGYSLFSQLRFLFPIGVGIGIGIGIEYVEHQGRKVRQD